MSDIAVQASFNAGEWAPALNARVDLTKYKSGAALLQNFFVDYRGGASTRPGTKYTIQAYKSSTAVRVIPFQAAFNVGYALELGDQYIRFIYDGSPILENPVGIDGATQANPCVLTFGANIATAATADNSAVSASYAVDDTVIPAGGTFSIQAKFAVATTLVASASALVAGNTNYPYYKGYAPGEILTLSGGVSTTQAQATVTTTKVVAAYLYHLGSGGTPGAAVLTGTTGTGTKFQINAVIAAGGELASIGSFVTEGSYTVNPTFDNNAYVQSYAEPVTGGGLSGAILIIQMGVGTVSIATPGVFTANPTSGVLTQSSSSGNGLGATFTGVFGIDSLGVVQSGSYGVIPSNPAVQASTSGSGAGATYNITWGTGATYNVNDWIFISGVGGMTQLNGRYFSISAVNGLQVSLADLNGNSIDSTGYSAYTSGGQAQRIYTIASPWAAADLALIKFAQSINEMILCHPNYASQVLTIVTPTDWTLVPISIGSQATIPTPLTISTSLSSGSTTYSYVVTSIDALGEESGPSTPIGLSGYQDIRSVAGSISLTWTLEANAVRYNIYKSDVSYFGVVPPGQQYGYCGTVTNNTFVDSNIDPDFSTTPPIAQNPFTGSGIGTVTVTAPGTYTSVPTATTSGGSPSIPATLIAALGIKGTPTITSGGSGFAVDDLVQFGNGVVMSVTTESGGAITGWSITSPGQITTGPTPSNPVTQTSSSGVGTGAEATFTWGVEQVIILAAGAGYGAIPTIVFGSGAATATATLTSTSNGNPSVPSFFQQRLVLAAPLGAPQTFYMSRPGAFFNFDVSQPLQDDDSIEGTLVSGVLNTIKAMVSATSGMLILTDRASWLVNGGQNGSAVTPISTVANAQSFIGANDVPPIVANYDVLYVPSKGSGVRDLAFNIYFNVFTGTDISILSSHLFFGFDILEWAWAEQPFYVVWAVRNDGTMLTLTFLKEQDFTGWAHSVTEGNFKSVTVVTEATSDAGNVDAVYTVVERVVNSYTVKYIERVAERIFPNGVEDAWCVDSGLQYVGAPASSFTGAEHLAGLSVTGLADGQVIPTFTMPLNGEFTIPTSASKVTVGIGYTCRLQTLALDIGEPTVQGKVKKINNVDVRVADTLGLEIGSSFGTLVSMKDTVVGNVSSMLTGQPSQIVTNLLTGDARTWLDPTYTVPGQYCIQQSGPVPASVLGVFPSITIGDDSARTP